MPLLCQLTDLRRTGYNAAIGALAIGGHLGEPFSRLLDSTGRPVPPATPDAADITQLEQVTATLTALDLRHGGGLTSQLAKPVLRFATQMLDTPGTADPGMRPLHAAVSALAARAAWSAFDTAAHEPARSLFRLALYTAVQAGDPNLRAHILTAIAAQHNELGYHHDALEIIRLAEGDERTAAGVRMLLHAVKARIYAALGEADLCRRHVHHADQVLDHPEEWPVAPGSPWVDTLLNLGHLYAATGHALATLAGRPNAQDDADEAKRRLIGAVNELDPATHARTRTLAAIRLAILQLTTQRVEPGAASTALALQSAAQVRSARVTHGLATIRTLTTAHADHPAIQAVTSDLDAVIDIDAESRAGAADKSIEHRPPGAA